MLKRMIAFLLCALLLLGLAACGGGGDTPSNSGGDQTAERPQGGETGEPAKPSAGKVRDLALTEYTDMDAGYTMLCPDVRNSSFSYSDYWLYPGTSDERKLFFSFAEYEAAYSLYGENGPSITDPHELLAYFMPIVSKMLGYSEKLYLNSENVTELTWNDTTVSGLPAAAFRGTIEVSENGPRGLTGICVVGEKRPYLFWAYDFTEDQSNVEFAQEVLEACVKNFKEGS